MRKKSKKMLLMTFLFLFIPATKVWKLFLAELSLMGSLASNKP